MKNHLKSIGHLLVVFEHNQKVLDEIGSEERIAEESELILARLIFA